MLLTLLVIVLIVAMMGGAFGFREYGGASLTPLGLVLIIIVLLYALGHLS